MMKTKRIILIILILYYISIVTILLIGYKGNINPWLVSLQTISGITIFFALIISTQLIYSTNLIKSKIVTIGYFAIIVFILLFCLCVSISDWASLSENIYGYISLVLSILISIFLSVYYYKKYVDTEIKDFKKKISKNLLLISSGFTLLSLVAFYLSYKLMPIVDNISELFKGFGIIVSMHVGIAIFLWVLVTYLIERFKNAN